MVEAQEAIAAGVPPLRRKVWTRAEYARMINAGLLREGDHVELIAGEIVAKVTQNSPHATGVSLGQEALRAAFGSGYHVRVQLPLSFEPDSEPEPDLAIVVGTPRDYRDAHPASALLVIEVADSSLVFDRTWKGSLYALAAIPEYWITNLGSGLIEVYRDPGPDPAALLGHGYRQRLSIGPDGEIVLAAIPHA